MKKPPIAILALCATLAGCSSDRKPQAKSYSPLVPEGAIAMSIRDAAALRSSPMFNFIKKLVIEQQAAAAEAKADDDTPNAVRKFAETIGGVQYAEAFDRACAREKWSIVTMGPLPFTAATFEDDDAKITIQAIAMVAATCEPTTTADSFAFLQTLAAPYKTFVEDILGEDDDNEKAELLAKVRDAFEISTDTVAGCEVRKLTLKRNDETAELLDHITGFEPCFGVFDGSLEIFASSTQVFADTVALYSGQAKAAAADSRIARDALLGSGAQIRFGVYGIGDILAKFAGEKIDELDSAEAGKFLKAALDLKVEESLGEDSIDLAIRASFADDSLAPILSSLIDGGLGMAKMAVAMGAIQVKEMAPIVQIVNGVSVKAQGDECAVVARIARSDIEAIDFAAISKAAADRAGEFGMIKTSGGDDDDDMEEVSTCFGDKGDDEDASGEDGGDE